MDEQGVVFDIQRFSVNDGPGIRTSVFLKGCPLDCRWCHNPESKAFAPVLSYDATQCIGCGACTAVCEHHTLMAGVHSFHRADCIACGRCAAVCPAKALELVGRRMTVAEVLTVVRRDQAYYAASGGGLTVTGGEPLAQPAFLSALLQAAKAEGLSTCVETSGYAPWTALASVVPYTDCFLYDCKDSDPVRHHQNVGGEQGLILDNLRRLSEAGATIVLRCPIIPGYNDRPEHLAQLGHLADSLPGVCRVEVEPYHALGEGKLARLGLTSRMAEMPSPSQEEVAGWIAAVAQHTAKDVRQG